MSVGLAASLGRAFLLDSDGVDAGEGALFFAEEGGEAVGALAVVRVLRWNHSRGWHRHRLRGDVKTQGGRVSEMRALEDLRQVNAG